MRFWHRVAGAVVAAMTLAPVSLVAPAVAAPQTINVTAGTATTDQGVIALEFLPNTITVDAGDTVAWADGSLEPHVIAFGTLPGPIGSPITQVPAAGTTITNNTTFVSSGIFPPIPGTSYKLTFPNVGTYNYMCTIHPSMKGSVVVQPAGTAYPASQATYKAAADPLSVNALAAGQAAEAGMKTTSAKSGSTTAWSTLVGTGDGKTYAILRFASSSLTINVGDSVKWTQPDPNEIHTVTFLNPGQDVPIVLPNGDINPVAVTPAGGNTYAGTGFVNSGALTPGQSFTLTFTKAGAYKYVCLVHDEQGMVANITVVAAAAQVPAQVPAATAKPATATTAAATSTVPTALPHTGTGGSSSTAWMLLFGLGILFVGTGSVLFARKRA